MQSDDFNGGIGGHGFISRFTVYGSQFTVHGTLFSRDRAPTEGWSGSADEGCEGIKGAKRAKGVHFVVQFAICILQWPICNNFFAKPQAVLFILPIITKMPFLPAGAQ
jgi:hypothetical protein